MKKIISFLVVFGIINLALFGIQKITHISDNKRIKELEPTLTALSKTIKLQESDLGNLNVELDTLDTSITDLAGKMDSLLAKYPNGAPEYVVNQYNSYKDSHNSQVDEHNNKVDKYNTLYTAYHQTLTEYNKLVDEYNLLGAKTSKYLLLIPIPRLR